MSKSIVFIERYQVEASIGVFAWEKKIAQTLLFDLQLQCDFSVASVSDDVKDAVDYGAVCESIDLVVSSRHFELLESLAEAVSDRIFSLFPVQNIILRISKPGAVPGAENVGVQIERLSKN
jgi:dihydroneopterin aldolase